MNLLDAGASLNTVKLATRNLTEIGSGRADEQHAPLLLITVML
jgi:hypothetical protein